MERRSLRKRQSRTPVDRGEEDEIDAVLAEEIGENTPRVSDYKGKTGIFLPWSCSFLSKPVQLPDSDLTTERSRPPRSWLLPNPEQLGFPTIQDAATVMAVKLPSEYASFRGVRKLFYSLQKGNSTGAFVLVKWRALPMFMSSWISISDFYSLPWLRVKLKHFLQSTLESAIPKEAQGDQDDSPQSTELSKLATLVWHDDPQHTIHDRIQCLSPAGLAKLGVPSTNGGLETQPDDNYHYIVNLDVADMEVEEVLDCHIQWLRPAETHQPDYDPASDDPEEGKVLICERCLEEYHMEHLPVPMTFIPPFDWICHRCLGDPSSYIMWYLVKWRGYSIGKSAWVQVHPSALVHLDESLKDVGGLSGDGKGFEDTKPLLEQDKRWTFWAYNGLCKASDLIPIAAFERYRRGGIGRLALRPNQRCALHLAKHLHDNIETAVSGKFQVVIYAIIYLHLLLIPGLREQRESGVPLLDDGVWRMSFTEAGRCSLPHVAVWSTVPEAHTLLNVKPPSHWGLTETEWEKVLATLRTTKSNIQTILDSMYEEQVQWPPTSLLEWIKAARLSGTGCGGAVAGTPSYKPLRWYQVEGLTWLLNQWGQKHGGILADEMGLGKTIQTLTLLQTLAWSGNRGPFLVVAPLSTLNQWAQEAVEWTDLFVVHYHGSKSDRAVIRDTLFQGIFQKGKPSGGKTSEPGAGGPSKKSSGRAKRSGNSGSRTRQSAKNGSAAGSLSSKAKKAIQERVKEAGGWGQVKQVMENSRNLGDGEGYLGPFSGRAELVLMSYEMVLSDIEHLSKVHWECLVIDEAHR